MHIFLLPRLSAVLLMVSMCFLPTALHAEGYVFVPKREGFAWWAHELAFLPTAVSEEGVSVADINRWAASREDMKADLNICFLGFPKRSTILSPDRTRFTEIQQTLSEHPNSFAQWFEPVPGKRFLVRIGVFETCAEPGPEAVAFMAVLVTNEAGAIQEFDALDWNFMRLEKSEAGIMIYGCYLCGERRELGYDAGNDRFYYIWTGH